MGLVTTRFDVERAVRSSDLPTLERLLLFVLLQHADNDSSVIHPRFTPSLTALASETGMDRTTVARNLRRLETKGWLTRQAPPVEQSRKGVRTRYQLAVPVVAPRHQVVAPRHQASGTTPPGVVAQDHMPSGPTPPMFSKSLDDTHSTTRDARGSGGSRNGKPGPAWLDGAVEFVTERLTAVTGRSYDRRDITESVTSFLRGKTVSNPGGYVRKSADKNPLQFEPTPGPSRFRKEDFQ